jgi:hypothetical protein
MYENDDDIENTPTMILMIGFCATLGIAMIGLMIWGTIYLILH